VGIFLEVISSEARNLYVRSWVFKISRLAPRNDFAAEPFGRGGRKYFFPPFGKGGIKGGFKEVEGGMRRGGVEEAKGLPQKSRSGFPMDDRIKAACLDENTYVLEMDVS